MLISQFTQWNGDKAVSTPEMHVSPLERLNTLYTRAISIPQPSDPKSLSSQTTFIVGVYDNNIAVFVNDRMKAICVRRALLLDIIPEEIRTGGGRVQADFAGGGNKIIKELEEVERLGEGRKLEEVVPPPAKKRREEQNKEGRVISDCAVMDDDDEEVGEPMLKYATDR